jgi:hypothetical protein
MVVPEWVAKPLRRALVGDMGLERKCISEAFTGMYGVGAWSHAGKRCLLWFAAYLIRVETDMLRPVIRLSTAHPIFASVF